MRKLKTTEVKYCCNHTAELVAIEVKKKNEKKNFDMQLVGS